MELVIGIAVVLLFGVYLSWTAGRLDRLHARVDAARAVLEAQLFRRSGAALDVASAGMLDPASAMLVANAASLARTADPAGGEAATTGLSGGRERPGTGLGSDWEQAESDLTEALCETLDDPAYIAQLREVDGAGTALDELAAACRRVNHARRFHNDTVRAARRLRRKVVVRWLRLFGYAPWPETVELDDAVPKGLGG